MSVLVLLCGSAFAGGYYFSDSGIVATGRGGAFVAGARGQFAQHYNPAGLIHTDRPTVNVGWSGVQQEVTFTRLASDGTSFPPVENEADPFDTPELGFVTPLGPRFALGVGFYSSFAPSSLYDEEGPQRYSIKETSIYEFSVGPSLAFRVHPMLTVGAGLQWHYFDVSEAVDVTLTGVDDPVGDIGVKVHAVDAFTPGWNAGLQFTPHRAVTFGLAVQPGTHFGAKGRIDLDFSSTGIAVLLDPTKYHDDAISLDIGIPWVVRAGVAVRPVEPVEIELAAVWQDWSALGDILVEDIDVEVQSESPAIPPDERAVDDAIALDTNLRDTVSVRLGGEWRAHDHLGLRLGGFWENGAVAPEDLSVALVDMPKVQVGGGASAYALDERVAFHGSFAWLFFQDQALRNSTVDQIDAGVFDDTQVLTVGNGDLSSHGWIVGLAGSFAFGQRQTPWEPRG